MINRKAQQGVGGLSGAVVALGVAAIILVLMLVILQEVRDTPIVTSSESSGTINNETTPTVVNDTAFSGQFTTAAGGFSSGCTVTGVTLENRTEIIDPANFTVSGCTITSLIADVVNSSSRGSNNSIWNITYSFTSGGEVFKSANETIVGLGTFGDFWTIIVLAVIAGVVIAIIFGAFGGLIRGRR